MSPLLEKLKSYGADIDGILERFLNDESLYEKCYVTFFEDDCFEKLEEALASLDYEKAFEYAHTLKGVAGNMGLTPVYETVSALVEPLRRHDYSNIPWLHAQVAREYNKLKKLEF